MESTQNLENSQQSQQIDPSTLQSLLGGTDGASLTPQSLIPESLITTLTIGFIVLNVLGILFFIFFVISLIRKWKVESAILHMRKDLAEIKATLAEKPKPVIVPPAAPASNNQVIATEPTPSSNTQLS